MKILLCSDSHYPHPDGVAEYMHLLHAYLKPLGNRIITDGLHVYFLMSVIQMVSLIRLHKYWRIAYYERILV